MKQLLYILALFVVISCTNGKEKKRKENKPSVVIFEQPLYPLRYKIPFKNIIPAPTGVPVISYSSGEDIKYYNPKKANDTLVLDNLNRYVELSFNAGFEDYNYLMAPNDTILFSIDEYGRPTLKSKTSKQLTELYNFPYKIKHGTPFFCYRPLTGLKQFGMFLMFLKTNPSLAKQHKEMASVSIDTLEKSVSIYQENYKKSIDSLKNCTSIPQEYFEYWAYRQNLDTYLLELSYFWYNKESASKEKLTAFFNDKYVKYPSYHNAASKDFLVKYFRKQEKVKMIKQSSGADPDWRDFYDKVKKEKYPSSTKNIMLKYLLKEMSNLFSPKSMQKYLDDYLAQTGDSITVNKIVNPHGLSKSEQKLETKALLLRDVQGNTTTLEKVLTENKGYVIYADFWASYCSTCMRMMPAAKKLHKKYRDKKVKFLYFSSDASKDAWESGMEKAGIKKGSYLILNPKDAPVIKKLKIYSIPRFLVFNKNGKLVEAKAPNPDVEKIEGILDKYLK